MHTLPAHHWHTPRVWIVGAVPANDRRPRLPGLNRRRGTVLGGAGQRRRGRLAVQLLFVLLLTVVVVVVQTARRLIQSRGRPEHRGKGRWVVHAFENARVPRITTWCSATIIIGTHGHVRFSTRMGMSESHVAQLSSVAVIDDRGFTN